MYFVATVSADVDDIIAQHPNLLLPVIDWTDVALQAPVLLIDSGVFTIANRYSKQNNLPLSEALAMEPEDVPGFVEMLETYIRIIGPLRDRVWGYMEIDFGSPKTMTRIRGQLEGQGFNPIPVFHAMRDPWSYLAKLMEQYDRVAIGSLVGARLWQRRAIYQNLIQYRTRYPGVHLHALGVAPSYLSYSYPVFDSMDSSTYKTGIVFGKMHAFTMLQRLDTLDRTFTYELGDKTSHTIASRLGSYSENIRERIWQSYLGELATLEVV